MTPEEKKRKNAERSKRWRDAHPDYMSKYMEGYRQEHLEEMREADRQYHEAHRDEKNAYRRQWAKDHPEQDKAATAAWHAANPEKVKNAYLKRRYGIDLVQYRALLVQQERACAICGNKFEVEFHRFVHVDHNHVTGQVRGILCHACNTLLGLARENPTTLQKAVDYLNSSSKSTAQDSNLHVSKDQGF